MRNAVMMSVLVLTGCVGDNPTTEDVLSDIGYYHVHAYSQRGMAVSSRGTHTHTVSADEYIAGEAHFVGEVSDGWALFTGEYTNTGPQGLTRWSGQSAWTIPVDDPFGLHTLDGEFTINGEAVDVTLELWLEPDGADLYWMLSGEIDGEVVSGLEILQVYVPEDDDDTGGCRAEVGVDCG